MINEQNDNPPGIPLELVRVYCKACKGWYGDSFGSCSISCQFDGLSETERPKDNLMVAVYKLLWLNSLENARNGEKEEEKPKE